MTERTDVEARLLERATWPQLDEDTNDLLREAATEIRDARERATFNASLADQRFRDITAQEDIIRELRRERRDWLVFLGAVVDMHGGSLSVAKNRLVAAEVGNLERLEPAGSEVVVFRRHALNSSDAEG